MFGYQRNFNSEVEVIDTVDKFHDIVVDPHLMTQVGNCRACLELGNKEAYDLAKRALPMFIFQASDFDVTKNKQGKEGKWRVQKAAHLNGLCVLDIDHVDDPTGVFNAKIKPWIEGEKTQRTEAYRILLVYVTPSGHGLKVVFTADIDAGNLADNQAAFSRLLGVENDVSIKDASRTSFAVSVDEFLYFDMEKLIAFNNEDYDKKYGEEYRNGKSAPTKAESRPRGGSVSDKPITLEELKYGDISVEELCRRYTERYGTPVEGDRHRFLVKMAGQLRYIVDNNERKLKVALRAFQWVREWESKEKNGREIDDVAEDVCKFKMWREVPKAITFIIGSANCHNVQGAAGGTCDARTAALAGDCTEIWDRLRPLLEDDPLYSLCTSHLPAANKIAGVFAAGAMFDTLATRCTYQHFDGRQHRMNPNVIIVGNPASGKSFADELDNVIMAVMRAADEPGRKAEAEYKKEQKKRRTSNKAEKGEQQLKEPEECIRYIPSRTSNAVFYRRQKNAKEIVNGDVMPLHLYTFDSELDSSVTAQSGGSWIAKHDLELKAFHNEKSGVDYANSDSVNEVIDVYWNCVSTGTDVSLAKKINMRNINDGLCSRVAICRIAEDNFRMIEQGDVKKQEEAFEQMRQWSLFFDGLKGEIIIPRLVKHVYNICAKAAKVAELNDDRVLDYLRKRAVFYAIWFTIPRIMAKTEVARKKNPKLDVMKPVIKQSDLDFAELVFDAVVYYQDIFFGRMLEDCWQNGKNAFIVRPQTRTTRNEGMFAALPDEFTYADVQRELGVNKTSATSQITRWKQRGLVKSDKRGVWTKIKM